MKTYLQRIFYLSLIVTVLSVSKLSGQDLSVSAEVTQIFRPVAVIEDPASIELILDAYLLIVDASEVEKIEIIDITNNGFGNDDFLIVYPSLEVFELIDTPPEVEEIMRGWSFDEQQRDGLNLDPDYFYPHHADTLESWELEETDMELVQSSLISDILLSLNRNYNELPFSLRLERDEDGFTFQMWNFDEDAFRFTPRPPATPDSIAVHDMMYVFYSDSTIVADTTYYDLIYMNRTIEDVIYLPGNEERHRPFETRNLPGVPSAIPGSTDAARND